MIIENNNIFVWIIVVISSIGLIYLGLKYILFNSQLSKTKNKFGIIFLLLSILTALISILGFKIPSDQKQKINGTNIIFLLDVSKSMNTLDVSLNNHLTTRLNLAKQAIKTFISKNLNNKYGLVIFTKQASTIIPPTTDKETFLTLLSNVDYKNLTKQGTNFSVGLKQATNTIKLSKIKNGLIVLISDGGDSPEDLGNLNFSLPKNIKLVVIGVGSKKGGRIFLGTDVFGEPIFQTYNGQYVITKLNEENLKKFAEKFNGKYFHLTNSNQILKIKDFIQKQANQIISIALKNYKDLTRNILIVSFLFFIVYLFIEILYSKK